LLVLKKEWLLITLGALVCTLGVIAFGVALFRPL